MCTYQIKQTGSSTRWQEVSAGWKNGWPVIAASLPLSLSVKVIREMFMPQPSPTSHHHFMLSSSFLLPACICRHLLCGGIVVQVTAVHLIREMFMPGLLGGLHCLHCLQYNLPILPPHHRAAGLVSHHLSKQSVLQSSSPNLGICKCTNSENMQRSL